MADKPILFSAPMVKALLAGAKTQTRRLFPKADGLEAVERTDAGGWRFRYRLHFDPSVDGYVKPPRIAVGDRLYVRETWSGIHAFRDTPPAQRESVMTPDGPLLRDDVWFWADGNPEGGDYEKPRPGIHMPRWASRLTLNVTDVRVERLQDISEEDAIAEGLLVDVDGDADSDGRPYSITSYRGNADLPWDRDPVEAYLALWDAINGDGAADANPWVAAYSFRAHHGNIDQMGGE